MSMGIPNAYDRSIDCMDKKCDGHLWCTFKTTDIQNNFRLSFRRSCVGHLFCINKYRDYMYRNGVVP